MDSEVQSRKNFTLPDQRFPTSSGASKYVGKVNHYKLGLSHQGTNRLILWAGRRLIPEELNPNAGQIHQIGDA